MRDVKEWVESLPEPITGETETAVWIAATSAFFNQPPIGWDVGLCGLLTGLGYDSRPAPGGGYILAREAVAS